MSLKDVIKKSVAKIGPKAGQTIYYAQPAAQDSVTFHSLCKRIAEESALTSADVKGILDRLVNILSEELPNGKTVRIGELGSFRLSFGSKQLDDPKNFSVDCRSDPEAQARLHPLGRAQEHPRTRQAPPGVFRPGLRLRACGAAA